MGMQERRGVFRRKRSIGDPKDNDNHFEFTTPENIDNIDKIQELAHYSYLGFKDINDIVDILNPLDQIPDFLRDNPVLSTINILTDPSYIGGLCKYFFNIDLSPFQMVILRELLIRPFPMFIASRGAGKTWLMAVYIMIKLITENNCKIVVVGSGFRQAKYVFDYAARLWEKSPLLWDMTRKEERQGPVYAVDRCVMRIFNNSLVALPLGNGEKIRGERAKIILADEFNSIALPIYETVVSGFASVSADPIEEIKKETKREVLQKYNMWTEVDEEEFHATIGNQSIISGTPGYAFQNFYPYWKRYKAIIESRGNPLKLREILGGAVPADFRWQDYSIIRLPYDLLPRGFMDKKHMSRAQVTLGNNNFLMEYKAVFPDDSDGFYKRSVIEKCVTKTAIAVGNDNVQFRATLKGEKDKRYIYGIDPASEVDNLTIIILEVHNNHRRIVHAWSTNKPKFKQRSKAGVVKEKDFYLYVVNKLRSLFKIFPPLYIGMDKLGGGIAIEEAFCNPDILEDGDQLILPYIKSSDDDPFWWEEKNKQTDDISGLHILFPIKFANGDWVSKANHGLRFDLENKLLLFPFFDAAEIEYSLQLDKLALGMSDESLKDESWKFDTLEDCVMEIEELKDELTSIEYTAANTSQRREKWDTPEIKLPNSKKGRLRKDRYSALLIANMIARTMNSQLERPVFQHVGGFVRNSSPSQSTKPDKLYVAPSWFTDHEYNRS